jgi:hypothetical protein
MMATVTVDRDRTVIGWSEATADCSATRKAMLRAGRWNSSSRTRNAPAHWAGFRGAIVVTPSP